MNKGALAVKALQKAIELHNSHKTIRLFGATKFTFPVQGCAKVVWFAQRSLELNGKLMELDAKNGKLRVNYGDRLVTLLREVRTLTSLGFPIAAKIQHTANVGQKFYRHGVILKQVKGKQAVSFLICVALSLVLSDWTTGTNTFLKCFRWLISTTQLTNR